MLEMSCSCFRGNMEVDPNGPLAGLNETLGYFIVSGHLNVSIDFDLCCDSQ